MVSCTLILSSYELHAQALSLVCPQRPRSAVAFHAQSLCHPRLRVHAAADAGQQSLGVLPAFSQTFSDDRKTGPRPPEGRHGTMGRARLLRPGEEPAQAGPCGQRDLQWKTVGPARGAATATG